MPSKQFLPTHELYAEQLLPLNLGYGLYEPDLDPGIDAVRIGDIGYILNGRFERVASMFLPGNGVDIVVEEKFRKINTYGDIVGPVLSSKNIRSVKINGDVTANAVVPVGISFMFSCESTSGASLVKKYRATDEKSAFPNILKKRFDDCVQSVYEFVKEEGHPITDLRDIILVIGRVMTGDWATIAFHNHSQGMNISFHVQAPVAGASFSFWGEWSEDITFPRKVGPRRLQNTIPEGEEPALDQCVFIDTYRAYGRSWYNRLKASLRITQKKGPSEATLDNERGERDTVKSGLQA